MLLGIWRKATISGPITPLERKVEKPNFSIFEKGEIFDCVIFVKKKYAPSLRKLPVP